MTKESGAKENFPLSEARQGILAALISEFYNKDGSLKNEAKEIQKRALVDRIFEVYKELEIYELSQKLARKNNWYCSKSKNPLPTPMIFSDEKIVFVRQSSLVQLEFDSQLLILSTSDRIRKMKSTLYEIDEHVQDEGARKKIMGIKSEIEKKFRSVLIDHLISLTKHKLIRQNFFELMISDRVFDT